jgi:hypothetical protein
MNLERAICNINRSINKKKPKAFNDQWIKNRCKISYQFIVENIKTEFDEPDWDLIVSKLERHNQKLWMKKIKRSEVVVYQNKKELNLILNNHKNKLYTFFGQLNKEDREICDLISIKLVRLSQKGNLSAKKKTLELCSSLVEQWIEYDKSLYSWKGYNELAIEHIEACIRRFRYVGSFLGYLHRTLQYSGLGLVPLEKFSLDDFSPVTEKRIVETFVKK